MRKFTLLVLLAIAYCYLPAQFNLTDARMPQPGEKQYYQYVDTANFNPGAAGTGQTWNFSSFADSMAPFYTEAIDPATGPHATDFGSNSSVGVKDGEGNYTYYDHSTGTFTITGVNNSLTLGGSAVYSDLGLRYNLPTTFNMTYADSIVGQFTALAGIAYRTGSVETTVDADGSITLPNGNTHSGVIRVKHVINTRDSANIFGNTIISTATTTYYEWYDSTRTFPVMVSYRVTGNALGNAIDENLIYYAAVDTTTSIAKPEANLSFTLSPNPFSSVARLSFSMKHSGKLQADLLDLSGRVVKNLAQGNFGSGNHDMIVNGETLKPGVYFVRLRTEGSEMTRKLVHF